jgi:integrase
LVNFLEREMAGTVRLVALETRNVRMKHKPGRQPYWRNLILGRLAVGYHRQHKGKAGRWLMRTTLGGDRWRVAGLGLADDYSDADGRDVLTFDDACSEARRRYGATSGGTVASVITVGDAIEAYIAFLQTHRASARGARLWADKLILPVLGNVRLRDLTTGQLEKWRNDLANAPARVRSAKGAPQRYKRAAMDPRARRATVNRIWTTVRAALNKAFRDGHIDSDLAWRRVKQFERVDAARPGFLQVSECSRLINACDPDFRPLAQAALLTGARYGELCAMRVADYHPGRAIHVPRSKSGKPRDIVLSPEGVKYFEAFLAGRAGDGLMFLRAGKPWKPLHQSSPMRDACKRAGLPALGIHQLRHTWASLAVMGGMPLMLVARNLGHRDTRMVERHYGHLSESFVETETKRLAPVFGIEAPAANVVRLK